MRLPILLTMLASVFGVAAGQVDRPRGSDSEQTLSSHMFDQGMRGFSRPPAEWQGKARRIRRSNLSNYGDGRALGLVSEILEFDAAGSMRRQITVDSPYQKSVQDIILVGNTMFSRMNGSPWQRKEWEFLGLAVPPGTPFETRHRGPAGTFKFNKPGATFEFKLGTGVFKGEVLRIYIRTIVSPVPGTEPGTVIEQEQTNRYWLADNGRMVKYEDVKVNRKTGARTHLTEEWELDPSIRIEAPIIQ